MFQVDEQVEIKGYIGGTFVAVINKQLVTLPINQETKTGIITKVIPGPVYSFMIKFICYEFPIEVSIDNITKCSTEYFRVIF